jgi:AraC-like DNA-binding protein
MRSRSSKDVPARRIAMQRRDPLAPLISLLRPQAVFSKLISGTGKWSVCYEHQRHSGYCVILDGSCFLRIEGGETFALKQGDFILLPDTPAFTLMSDLALRPRPIRPTPSRELHHGNRLGPRNMRMLGGYFRFAEANARLLVKLLPDVVHIARDEAGAARLRWIVEMINEEADALRPGREPMLERLVEVLLLEALRFNVSSTAKPMRGLAAGLSDPALGVALALIHGEVERSWTVAELARRAGMSRAAFAAYFAQVIGWSPMRYLLEWRMATAKELMRSERTSLSEVARRVGYNSVSAFSAAFTRMNGYPPSQFASSTT